MKVEIIGTHTFNLRYDIESLIGYYYEELGNCAGDNLHIILDDGNLEKQNILWCKDKALKKGDTLGVLICDVLMSFSEKELEHLYDNDWML